MDAPRLSCWSCRGYPIAPEPFKCMWAKYAMFPHGGERCNAFEREPGADEVVAVEERAIEVSQ